MLPTPAPPLDADPVGSPEQKKAWVLSVPLAPLRFGTLPRLRVAETSAGIPRLCGTTGALGNATSEGVVPSVCQKKSGGRASAPRSSSTSSSTAGGTPSGCAAPWVSASSCTAFRSAAPNLPNAPPLWAPTDESALVIQMRRRASARWVCCLLSSAVFRLRCVPRGPAAVTGWGRGPKPAASGSAMPRAVTAGGQSPRGLLIRP